MPSAWALAEFERELIRERTRAGHPEMGFLARLMTLCSMPRTNQKDRLQYVRRIGPYTLIMFANGKTKLPYGNLPRLLLAWVCTEAVRTQSRDLVLGRSLAEFMRAVGIDDDGGATRRRMQEQMRRLFGSVVSLTYKGDDGESIHLTAPAPDGAT